MESKDQIVSNYLYDDMRMFCPRCGTSNKIKLRSISRDYKPMLNDSLTVRVSISHFRYSYYCSKCNKWYDSMIEMRDE